MALWPDFTGQKYSRRQAEGLRLSLARYYSSPRAQKVAVSHLVKVLAEKSSGLRGGEVAELGHEVHLTLGQEAG